MSGPNPASPPWCAVPSPFRPPKKTVRASIPKIDLAVPAEKASNALADFHNVHTRPTKSNRKVQRPIDPAFYALRNRIKRFFN